MTHGIDWTAYDEEEKRARRCLFPEIGAGCRVLLLCGLSILGGVVLGVVGYAWISVCP